MEKISTNRRLSIIVDALESEINEYVKNCYNDTDINDHDFRIVLAALIQLRDYYTDQFTDED